MKKYLDYDRIIDYIKTVEDSEFRSVHRYETTGSATKEVYFMQTFTQWLKEQKITEFNRYDFNDYCKNVILIDMECSGKGRFRYTVENG